MPSEEMSKEELCQKIKKTCLLDGGSSRTDREPTDEDCNNVKETASIFLEASLMLPLYTTKFDRKDREITAAYLWGAVDALSQRANLYDVDAMAIHAILCHKFLENSPENAGRLAALSGSGQYPSVICRGGQAVIDWITEKDVNAPLALNEILTRANIKIRPKNNSTLAKKSLLYGVAWCVVGVLIMIAGDGIKNKFICHLICVLGLGIVIGGANMILKGFKSL